MAKVQLEPLTSESLRTLKSEIEAMGIDLSLLFDTHCHLTDKRFSLEEIAGILSTGVKALTLTISPDELKDLKVLLNLPYSENLFFAVGVHPHEVGKYSLEEIREFIERALSDKELAPKIVAIGEIGLDYYYEFSPKEIQIEAFKLQVDLALEKGLPLSVHSRDAEKEVWEILKEYGVKKAVLHGYTGSSGVALEATTWGLFIGVNGIITFKKADSLRDLIKRIPTENLLLETDSPYLTPVPYRGRRNNPLMVAFVLKALSNLKDTPIDQLTLKLRENARRLFRV